MAADGRILIDTKINTDGFTAGSQEVVAAARRMAESVSNVGDKAKLAMEKQLNSFSKLNTQYAAQEQRVEALRQKVAAYQDQKVPTEEYKQATKKVQDLEKALDKAVERQIKFVETGGKTGSRAFQGMEYDIERLREQLDEAVVAKHRLETSGRGFGLASETEAAIKDTERLAAEEAKLEDMGNRLNSVYQRLKLMISDYGGSLNGGAREMGFFQSALNGLRIAWNGLLNLPKNIFSGMVAGLKGLAQMAQKAALALAQLAGKGLISGLKKLSAGIFGIHKSANKSNMSLGGSLKTILKYGLGIRSLYALVNKLRTALVNGFKNLAQYSSATNATLSGLMASLEQCKNALATAFDPILQAVAPALNYLISLVTAAATAIAQLISALTGKETFVKAVKVQKDYAKSLKGTGGAAKKAGEEAEGSLASFDKLNVMAEDATSGGGGGGGGGGAASPEDMFETVGISSEFSNLADAIKNAWKNSDFTEVGQMLGAKLRDGLNSIPWDTIQSTAEKIGKSLATLINGAVSVEGLAESIGRTIGEAINTGIIGINAFLDNTAWDKVGEFLGQGANALVDTINWEGLGHLFAAKFNAIFTTLGSFAATFDWSNFGASIGAALTTAIQDFDWAGAGESLGIFLTGLVDALKALIDTTDWTSLGSGITSAIASFFANIDWSSVGGLLSSFLTGLCDFLTGLIEGIDWSAVPQKIIDAISDFFKGFDYEGTFKSVGNLIGTAIAAGVDLLMALKDILSDGWDSVVEYFSGYIEDSGGDIVLGLYNGIKDALKNIGAWIKTNIIDPFVKGFKDGFGIHSPSTVMQEMGKNLMQGLLNGIIEFLQPIIEKFTELKNQISSKWEEIKSNTSEAWENIKSTISEKVDAAKEKASEVFGNLKNDISDKWNDIKKDTGEKWEQTKKALVIVWDALKEKAGPIFTTLKDAALNAWKAVKEDNSWDVIKSNLFGIWDALEKKVGEVFGAIQKTVKEAWEGLKNFGSNVASGITGGGGGSKSNTQTMSLRTYAPATEAAILPHLATGTVVPPRAGEFAAILGDNNREAEVVSPLSTIEKALDNVMAKYAGSMGGDFRGSVYLDRRELGRSMVEFVREEKGRTGKNPLLV